MRPSGSLIDSLPPPDSVSSNPSSPPKKCFHQFPLPSTHPRPRTLGWLNALLPCGCRLSVNLSHRGSHKEAIHEIHANSNRCEGLERQLQPSGRGWTSASGSDCTSMHVCTHVDSVMSINMYDNAQRGVVNKTCNRRGFPGWVLISEAGIVRTSQCPVQMSQRSAGHAEGNAWSGASLKHK